MLKNAIKNQIVTVTTNEDGNYLPVINVCFVVMLLVVLSFSGSKLAVSVILLFLNTSSHISLPRFIADILRFIKQIAENTYNTFYL